MAPVLPRLIIALQNLVTLQIPVQTVTAESGYGSLLLIKAATGNSRKACNLLQRAEALMTTSIVPTVHTINDCELSLCMGCACVVHCSCFTVLAVNICCAG